MNATHALGWALVQFLWQGAALAVLLAVALAVTRPAAARTRYALSLATLAAMLLLPIVTAVRLHRGPPTGLPVMAAEPGVASTPQADAGPEDDVKGRGTVAATVTAAPARLVSARAQLVPMLPWLVALWVGGVIVFSIRLARGWTAARRLRTQGTAPAPPWLIAMLEALAARLRIRRPVALLESALVQVPAVVGWLRPVILVPASALTGLAPQQIEVLIAHELAHVRRHDYLVNLAQSVVETLLFYHPGVWWVSRQIREAREHCCDDLVVRISGDPQFYASALVGMERLRTEPPRLALAASGGSLLQRVRRLVVPAAARRDVVAPWIAGVIAVTVALLAAGAPRVAGSSPASPAAVVADADTTRTAPDTVIRHPDPTRPLAERWEWAQAQARRLGRREYWIGYRIPRPAWLEHSVYIDREIAVTGRDFSIRGRLFGDFHGLAFRGTRLGPLLGGADSDDIAMLFGVRSGSDAVVRMHLASFYLPADFANRTLFWLGDAADAQSLAVVERLIAATREPAMREDLVAAVGIHGSSDLVVPILVRWLSGHDDVDVRAQAAEWLGFHPSPAAVHALSRAARGDGDGDVRREAAEALGDNALPAATDSAIAIARTARSSDVRSEAVEGLGQKDDERALAALREIAQSDRDADVQREAVESLGEMPNGRGLNAVRDLARTHADPDIRREAVETLGEHLDPAEAVPVLRAIVAGDPDVDVQREAVETLGDLHDARASALLVEYARSHPVSDVRREAIETLGESEGLPADSVVAILDEVARGSTDPDVAREAVATLGELGEGTARALERVAAIARRHPHPDVQREAIGTYAEHAATDAAVKLLSEILAADAAEDIYDEVLESLEELDGGAGIPALLEAARSHPKRDVRNRALRRLAESDDPRAQELFERTLQRP